MHGGIRVAFYVSEAGYYLDVSQMVVARYGLVLQDGPGLKGPIPFFLERAIPLLSVYSRLYQYNDKALSGYTTGSISIMIRLYQVILPALSA